jgi:hypothetical protein
MERVYEHVACGVSFFDGEIKFQHVFLASQRRKFEADARHFPTIRNLIQQSSDAHAKFSFWDVEMRERAKIYAHINFCSFNEDSQNFYLEMIAF